MQLSKRIIGLAGGTVALVVTAVVTHAAFADQHPQTAPPISMSTAVQSAAQSNSGKFVVEAKLKTERNVLLYEVELNDETDVHVDANTGKVMPGD
jgi:uncharacterized membrane protein YkoI